MKSQKFIVKALQMALAMLMLGGTASAEITTQTLTTYKDNSTNPMYKAQSREPNETFSFAQLTTKVINENNKIINDNTDKIRKQLNTNTSELSTTKTTVEEHGKTLTDIQGKITGFETGKADKTYVNEQFKQLEELVLKNLQKQITTAQNTANNNTTQIGNLQNGKADKTYVNEQLSLKANQSDLVVLKEAVLPSLKREIDGKVDKKTFEERKQYIDQFLPTITENKSLLATANQEIARLEREKANQSDLVVLKEAVLPSLKREIDGKVDKKTFEALKLEFDPLKEDVSTNKSDIDDLKRQKANTVDVEKAMDLMGKTLTTYTDRTIGEELQKAKDEIDGKLEGKADKKATNDEIKRVEGVANTAKTDASTALTNANNALTVANTAKQDATTAKNDASTALRKASEVEGVANSAKEVAGNALTVANTASTNATNALNAVDGFTNRMNAFDNRMSMLEARLNHFDEQFMSGMATQSALTGLFQPYTIGRANASVAMGGYGSKTAIAVGAGYRFNENFAGKIGFATSGDKPAYSIGFNFEFK